MGLFFAELAWPSKDALRVLNLDHLCPKPQGVIKPIVTFDNEQFMQDPHGCYS